MEKILTVIELLSQRFIEEQAIPSNITYGTAIHNRGAVKIIDSNDISVEAWVGGLDGEVIEGGGSKRRVKFTASKTGLQWSCTGNPKDHQIFCKHCVALAIWLIKL
jgi:uncharacterized Zn finger protein